MMHTSEKPNSCQYCDRKFRVQINIKWHEKRCEMHPNKKLKSKNLNKEKSKINEIENETLLSDNSIGEKHCNYSDGSPGEKELLSAISSIECTTIENLEDFNMTKKNNKARTSRNGWNTRPIPIFWIFHLGDKEGIQITTQGWIFWTMTFYNLKKFTSRSI